MFWVAENTLNHVMYSLQPSSVCMFLPFSQQCQQPVDYIFFHWVKLVSVWSVSTRPHSVEINGPLKGSACLMGDLHFLKVSFFTRTVDFFTRWSSENLTPVCLWVAYLFCIYCSKCPHWRPVQQIQSHIPGFKMKNTSIAALFR